MPFNRPTLSDIADRTRNDLNARLPGADSRLRRSGLDVLGRMHSGAVHGLYGFIEFISRQILPDTADAEHLQRWASIFGVARKAAEAAGGLVTMTGANGSAIPQGAVLQRGDQAEYVVAEAAVIALGTAAVAVTASTPGVTGNAVAGVALTLTSPISGVATNAVVAGGGLTGGVDEEGDDSLRARLLARIREQPMGGAQSDYERWAREVPGVTRAWVYPGIGGLGTVGVAFVMDNREDIVPLSADVDAVEAYIAARRPVTADVTVFAPAADPLDLTIDITPDTPEVRAAIEAELRDLLRREAEPGGTLLISHIRQAISQAAGETDHVLTTPAANVVSAAGDLAVLGTITWS
jgi:uncharacterized phage protein gp47/JayE